MVKLPLVLSVLCRRDCDKFDNRLRSENRFTGLPVTGTVLTSLAGWFAISTLGNFAVRKLLV